MRTVPYTGPRQGAPMLSVHKLYPHAKLPVRANEFAVGLDVFAYLLTESGRPTSRAIHQRAVTPVPTGIIIKPPDGYFVQVCSRSGLAKKSIIVATTPGIVDPDYSGELIILLYNGGHETHYVAHEHRIAQLILAPIVRVDITELTDPPPDFGRGQSGYGSTGL